MPVIKEQQLKQFIKTNQADGYSKAAADCIEKIIKILDQQPKLKNGYYPKKNCAHTLICENGNDLTGFQAGCVVEVVREHHTRGKEFELSYNQKL